MNEDFVTFKIAHKLKEKGFPQRPDYFNYSSYYYWDGLRKIHSLSNASVWFDPNINRENIYFAPTISQVLKWLRKEKKIHIEPCILADVDTDADGKIITYYTYWSFSIISIESGDMIYFEYEHMDDRRFDSFEEAALVGIEYVLDNLI